MFHLLVSMARGSNNVFGGWKITEKQGFCLLNGKIGHFNFSENFSGRCDKPTYVPHSGCNGQQVEVAQADHGYYILRLLKKVQLNHTQTQLHKHFTLFS